jgi:hypothetical protein
MKNIYIDRTISLPIKDEDGNVVATLRKPETFAIAVDKASSSLRFLKGDGSFGATLCDLNAAEIKTLS